MDNKKPNVPIYARVVTALLVVLLICVAILGFYTANLSADVKYLSSQLGTSTPTDENVPGGDIVTDEDERTELAEMFTSSMTTLSSKAYYFDIDTGRAADDSEASDTETSTVSNTSDTSDDEPLTDVLLTNSSGESWYQESMGNIAIFLNDKTSVYYGQNIYYGKDCTILDQLKTAVTMANDGKAEILKVSEKDSSEAGVPIGEYAIDIHGWDAIRELYTPLGDDYADSKIESIKQNIEDSNLPEDTSYATVRYLLVYYDGALAAMGRYYYFGEDAIGNWSSCYTDWYTDSFFEVYDWELTDDWYDYDYSKLPDSDGTDVKAMLDEQYNVISTMLDKFSADNSTYSDEFQPADKESGTSETSTSSSTETSGASETSASSSTETSGASETSGAGETGTSSSEDNKESSTSSSSSSSSEESEASNSSESTE